MEELSRSGGQHSCRQSNRTLTAKASCYVGTAAIGCSAAQRGENVYHRRMNGFTSAFTAFVLAGGRSRRMGTDKAFVLLDGRPLLARTLGLALSLTSDVCIVGDPAKFASFAPVVEDMFPGCGPLAGIHAALRSSQTELNLILAVDMPFLTPALLQY